MMKSFRVLLNERVVVFRGGLPYRALGPGRYTLWGSDFTEHRYLVDSFAFSAPAAVRALMPPDWYIDVALTTDQRGIVYHNDVPRLFLRPGMHFIWKFDDSVRVEVLSVQDAMPELTHELAAVFPRAEYVDVTVREFERGLQYSHGRLMRVLPSGRYAFWSTPASKVTVELVDMRRVQVAIVGQELMTADKVTLRLSVTVEYAVSDPVLATHAIANVKDAIYLLAQLAAREYVASVTLDEMLASRHAMTKALEEDVVPKAREFGVSIDRIGIKDVVLPGEMKTLLNRVIEAEKEAAANVILRREEVAATRSLANTARVMAEHPVLLRLKELESLKEIASRIQQVRVVVGADGLKSLLPSGMLTDGEKAEN